MYGSAHRARSAPVTDARRPSFPGPVRAVVTVTPPTIVTESSFPDGTRETFVGNSAGRSTSNFGVGAPTQHFQGRPSQNEENVGDALHRLRDTLNQAVGSRLWKEHVGHQEIAVDGTLTSSDGRVLKCQVTRVERDTLPTRGRVGRATSGHDTEALVARVIAAIESKSLRADPDMILVLAPTTPRHTRTHPGRRARTRGDWTTQPTWALGLRYGSSGRRSRERGASTRREPFRY